MVCHLEILSADERVQSVQSTRAIRVISYGETLLPVPGAPAS